MVIASLLFLPEGDTPYRKHEPFETPSTKPFVLYELPAEVTVRGMGEKDKPIEATLRRR